MPEEHQFEAFGKGIYTSEFTARTYGELLQRARLRLLDGRSVILDASFVRRSQRKDAARLAKETGAQFACIIVDAPQEAVRRRLARRAARGTGASDARWQTYVAQKRRFQRPSELSPDRLIMLNARRRADANAAAVLRCLRGISPLSLTD